MALTVGISLVGLFRLPQVINKCLFRPYFFLRQKQYDTMILSGFVHADLGHLLFNMVTFYFFAFPLERFIGTVPFLILYFAGLVFSHACTYVKQRNNPEYASLGASGAISAVLFAFIVYFPTTTLMIIPIPIPIPAVLFAIGYVGYSYWASLQSRGRINHDAHLCGALSGLGFVAVTDPHSFSELLNTLGTFLI
ncbi:MAG: rhomboid family intramembrane serine protease [Woeseiaceae bacterium]